VTEDIETRFSFNTAVSSIMELVNALSDYVAAPNPDPALVREVVSGLILILSPFVPFVAEELWRRTGHEDAVLEQAWPSFRADALAEETLEIPVQVNGKVRVRIVVTAQVGRDPALLEKAALAHADIAGRILGKELVKVIAIPEKMVSVVVR
jgi:leucyl-tRNA synthetase